jgi:predicted kinase
MPASGKQVVFLSGPIGVGKSTIGAALAKRLDGVFIESDALGDPTQDWHQKIDTVNTEIVAQSLHALLTCGVVVVELPLDEARWRRLQRAFQPDTQVRCITLAATFDTIVAADRGRAFSGWEIERIKVMIAEGYDRRSFSDAIVSTDQVSIADVVALIAGRIACDAKEA